MLKIYLYPKLLIDVASNFIIVFNVDSPLMLKVMFGLAILGICIGDFAIYVPFFINILFILPLVDGNTSTTV